MDIATTKVMDHLRVTLSKAAILNRAAAWYIIKAHRNKGKRKIEGALWPVWPCCAAVASLRRDALAVLTAASVAQTAYKLLSIIPEGKMAIDWRIYR
jgi:uncharacterized membrane protein YozB (DUF420 family)